MVSSCFLMMILLLAGSNLAQPHEESVTNNSPKSSKPAAEESKPKQDQREKPIQPYRLDFSVNELENGKKINSRHYSIDLTAGSANQIKIGTRVPVATGGSGWQYMDVGTNIWANLREGADDLQLEVRSGVRNIEMNSARDKHDSTARIVG